MVRGCICQVNGRSRTPQRGVPRRARGDRVPPLKVDRPLRRAMLILCALGAFAFNNALGDRVPPLKVDRPLRRTMLILCALGAFAFSNALGDRVPPLKVD